MSEINKKLKTSEYDSGALLEAKDDVTLVTLVAGEMQLAVHRSILVAKSPVFATELAQDKVEANSSRIVITDVEPKVLQQLVLFMYRDKAPQLCSMAPQLLVVADKYCMPDLKAQCELQLILNLCVENFMTSVLLALRHSCPRLKESARSFFQANLNKVMDTEGWVEAVRNNPEEFVDVSRLLALKPTKTRNTCQEEMDRQLFEAVKNSKLKEVREMLATGCYVGARDASGRTVLHYAATRGTARCLLEAGALVSAGDKWHCTPLHSAVQGGNKEVALVLIAASSDVNAADVFGHTPLHVAAELGYGDLVKALLNAGADKDSKNCFTETLLDVANRCNDKSISAMLSVSDSVNLSEIEENPKTFACDLGSLLDARDATLITLVAGETQMAVHRSVLIAKSPVCAAMLAHDTVEASSGRIVITDIEPEVLHQLLLFMYRDHAPQLSAMAPQLLVAADKYCMPDLKAKCEMQLVRDLSVENIMANVLLAMRHSCPHLKESARCFLQANLMKVMETEGWAKAVIDNPEEFVEVSHLLAATSLKTRSASQEERDRELLKKAESGYSITELIAAGASVRARDVSGRTALHFLAGRCYGITELNSMLSDGADLGARDIAGRTALHYAAANGYEEPTKCLLQAGASVDVVDRWLQTPLHAAIQRGCKGAVQLLLAAASDVNTSNVYGNMPLHLAARLGNQNMLQALLDVGADKGEKNNLRETPLDVAKHCNMYHLIAMLR